MTKRDFIAWYVLHKVVLYQQPDDPTVESIIEEGARIAVILDEAGFLYPEDDEGEEESYAQA